MHVGSLKRQKQELEEIFKENQSAARHTSSGITSLFYSFIPVYDLVL